MMIFRLRGISLALRLESIQTILAPGLPPPASTHVTDLARLLALPEASGIEAAAVHTVVLAGGGAALAAGHPSGTVQVEPGWILPLPGCMFDDRCPPFRGVVAVPRDAAAGAMMAAGAFLLDESALASRSPGET